MKKIKLNKFYPRILNKRKLMKQKLNKKKLNTTIINFIQGNKIK